MVDGRTDTDGHNQPVAGASGVSPFRAGAERRRRDSVLTRRSQRLATRGHWEPSDDHRLPMVGERRDAG